VSPCSSLGTAALGALAASALLAGWSWWASIRADVSWAAFWRPVRDTSLHDKPWLKVHLLAHLLGGAALGLFLFGPWFAPAWLGAYWQRLLALFVFQAAWERVQHENWKGAGGSSAYPWWSAVWDILITLAGQQLVELQRLLSGWPS